MAVLLFLCMLHGQGSTYQKLAVVDFDTSTLTTNMKYHHKTPDEKRAIERKIANELRSLSNALMTALERQFAVDYDLVERRKLQTVMREIQITHDNHSERPVSLAQRLREVVGADFILTGRITEFAIEKRNISNHAYFHGKVSGREYTRYQMAASFRLIDAKTGEIHLVDDAVTVTDSSTLATRSSQTGKTFIGIAYRHALCRDLASQIREALQTNRLTSGL